LIGCESGEVVVVDRSWRSRRSLVLTAIVVSSLVVLLGALAIERRDAEGREAGRLVHPRGNTSLAAARAFRAYPLYFAGESVVGLELEAIMRVDRTSPAPHTEFSFIYGACRSIGGQGCAPPLVILLWPACYRYETRYSIPPRERTVVRGVPARASREFRRLELYPARTTIIINGHGLKARDQLLEVGRRLRGVNVPLQPATALPARPPHAGYTIRCQSAS
jgi:hypothetical protein